MSGDTGIRNTSKLFEPPAGQKVAWRKFAYLSFRFLARIDQALHLRGKPSGRAFTAVVKRFDTKRVASRQKVGFV